MAAKACPVTPRAHCNCFLVPQRCTGTPLPGRFLGRRAFVWGSLLFLVFSRLPQDPALLFDCVWPRMLMPARATNAAGSSSLNLGWALQQLNKQLGGSSFDSHLNRRAAQTSDAGSRDVSAFGQAASSTSAATAGHHGCMVRAARPLHAV
jgi:hypothetical protein